MKQCFIIRKFTDSKPDAEEFSTQVVAFRRKEKLFLQNFEFDDRVRIVHDAEHGVVKFEVRLNEDEYLALGSRTGMAPKITVEDERG